LRLTFALKEFFKDQKANAQLVNHFLLGQARVQVRLVFEDSTAVVLAAKRGLTGKFTLDILPTDIPMTTVGPNPGQKKRISSLSMDFVVNYYYGAKTFQLIRILQEFSLQELPTNNDQNVDYLLSPFAWKNGAFALANSRTSKLHRANASVHPLLDLTKLSKNLIVMNALVVDLTQLWDYLQEFNENYQFYKEVSPADKVTFKVFAHLGGNSFIWYGVVPSYLANSSKVSPHIFYLPGDFGSKQNIKDDFNYLFNNPDQFNAKNLTALKDESDDPSNDAFNGNTLLLNYLLPPIDDEEIPALSPKKMSKDTFDFWVARRRNVVGFEYAKSKPSEIVTLHWNIGGGLQRAFYGLHGKKPQQFLLIPQPWGTDSSSNKGTEREAHLKFVTDAIFDLLQSNTELLSPGDDDELVIKDKLILSCYSESGNDLWMSSTLNLKDIKAIIGIEPVAANPQGRAIVPTLLQNKVPVYIIGRHRGQKKGEKWKDHYRPEIAPNLQAQIQFRPKDLKILKYPPNPASNDFVRFRVLRVTDAKLDSVLMTDDETSILEDLASAKKPITGDAVFPKIFKDLYNADKRPPNTDFADIMYTHSFALTGGEKMTLFDHDDPYKKGIKEYWTFFQQAVEEIG
jgi:hypothetical protein